MPWKRGDRCTFNDAIMRSIIKPICEESIRKPECYFVVAVDEKQSVAVIIGKDSRPMGVLTEWIVPYQEPAWTELLTIINQSSTPTELVKRLSVQGKEHENK